MEPSPPLVVPTCAPRTDLRRPPGSPDIDQLWDADYQPDSDESDGNDEPDEPSEEDPEATEMVRFIFSNPAVLRDITNFQLNH